MAHEHIVENDLLVPNGSVGIGTLIPLTTLHIAETNALPDITLERIDAVMGDNSDVGKINFRGGESTVANVASIFVEADAAWNDNDSPTRMTFSTTPAGSITQAERMIIDKDGQVGIGITPTAPIHVSTGDNQVAKFASTDSRASILVSDDDTTTFIGAENGSSYISNVSNLLTAGQIVIDSDGNVGIGTSAPIAKMEVKGESSIDGTAPVDFFISDITTSSDWVAGAAFGRLGFWSHDGSGVGEGLRGAITCNMDSSTGAGGELRLQTNDGSGIEDRVIIDRNGSVGIGALDPNSELHIAGSGVGITIERIDTSVLDGNNIGSIFFRGGETTIDDVAGILVEADSGWGADSSPTSMSFWTTPGSSTTQLERMIIDRNGLVGIGTTTIPSWDSDYDVLHLGDKNALYSYAGSSNFHMVNNVYYESATVKRIASGYATKYEANNNLGTITLAVADTDDADSTITWIDALTIDNNGYVGIGTDNPATGLHLAKTDELPIITLERVDSSVGNGNPISRINFRGGESTIADVASIFVETDADWANDDSPTRMTFFTTPASSTTQVERMRIDSAGNIGIGTGTSNPISELHIADNNSSSEITLERIDTSVGTGVAIGKLSFRGGESTISEVASITTITDGEWAADDSPTRIIFKTTPVGSTTSIERMRIDNAGNVDMQKQLTISGTTKTEGHFYAGDTDPDSTARINFDGFFYATKCYNPVYNDIADFQDVIDEIIPGMCYYDTYEGAKLCTQRCQMAVMGIASDTFGMSVGSDSNKEKIPVAISGWVLAYVDQTYPCGTALTNNENGYLTEITKEEKLEYPERLIATYKKPEESESWGPEDIEVNNRHWVKVK